MKIRFLLAGTCAVIVLLLVGVWQYSRVVSESRMYKLSFEQAQITAEKLNEAIRAIDTVSKELAAVKADVTAAKAHTTSAIREALNDHDFNAYWNTPVSPGAYDIMCNYLRSIGIPVHSDSCPVN